LAGLWGAIRAAVGAFRKAYLSTAADRMDRDRFGLLDARRLRYAIYEALYENTAYDGGPFGLHSWAQGFKTQFGLYDFCQGIHNPAGRIIGFAETHILGGALDPEAGDGVAVPSACPIVTEIDELRPAIAALWRASRWNIKKGLWTRRGAMLGDAPLVIRIDEARQLARLRTIHPKNLAHVERDDDDAVTGYVIEETRPDPTRTIDPAALQRAELDPGTVYLEICQRDGDDVAWQTYRDGRLYDWRTDPATGKPFGTGPGAMPEWRHRLPFVPLIPAQHVEAGGDWGLSELHAAIAKIVVADDAGSKVNDQIRKLVEAPWFFSGVTKRDVDQWQITRTPPTPGRPQAAREDRPLIFAQAPESRAISLVADLRIAEATDHVASLRESLEKDYPELQYERIRAAGDVNAAALREARKPAITKVNQRRQQYDEALACAQAMAVAWAGDLGFPAFSGFGVDDWGGPRLEHSIGARPVFEVEDIDRIEEDAAEAAATGAWVAAGVPVEVALERAGWSTEDVARVVQIKAAAEARLAAQAKVVGSPGSFA
jgi:hypothetical protein